MESEMKDKLDGWLGSNAGFEPFRDLIENSDYDGYVKASRDSLRKFNPDIDDVEEEVMYMMVDLACAHVLNRMFYRALQFHGKLTPELKQLFQFSDGFEKHGLEKFKP